MAKAISIVTINYNMKDGLCKTILSVNEQTARHEVEYIIIDGGSSDGSVDLVRDHVECVDIQLSEPDEGIFHAMNKGLSLATGRYIYFLNAGDVLASPHTIEIVLDSIRDARCSHNIIYGNVETYRLGQFLRVADASPWLTHQGAFVRSDLLKRYKFDERYMVFGDLDLWKRLRDDGQYVVYRIDATIAKMELDGVGTHPRFFFKRMKDKLYYARQHREYRNWIVACLIGFAGFVLYRILGESYYYNQWIEIKRAMRDAFTRSDEKVR